MMLYSVHEQSGRWLVCYPVPGQSTVLHVVADCPTRAAADEEVALLRARAEREARRLEHERQLLCRMRAGHRA